jgi:hypothetical protein
MSLSVVYRSSLPASASPYRLLDAQGHEITWANAFLDAQRLCQLSLRSLRAYAYDLLHFARWLETTPQPLEQITESVCIVSTMAAKFPPASPISSAPICSGPRSAMAARVARWPPRSAYDNPGAWSCHCRQMKSPSSGAAFRTFRDLALVGLMLLDGLRSCEVLSAQLQDLQLAQAQMRVLGKGNQHSSPASAAGIDRGARSTGSDIPLLPAPEPEIVHIDRPIF